MELRAERVSLPLREPLATAWGELTTRELVRVRLTGDDGVTGRGEAAPLEPYDGVPLVVVEEALVVYAEVLREAAPGTPGPALLDACRAVADIPQAIAAIDLALWDRAGRRQGRRVADLLTDDPPATVPVNATLGALDRSGAFAQTVAAIEAGFTCVKVKVGVGDDAARLAAVRAAGGPALTIRLDANGAWTVEQAVQAIQALVPVGLELVEEPVHGIAGLRAVREQVATRISMDETAGDAGALTASVADAVCLKVSRCGGLSSLLAQAALVRATGADVYLASSYDGPLGVAAAVHAAAALRVDLPCGLATLSAFDVAPPASLAVRDGRIAVPSGPGLL
ncbi:MAG: L-Ala-D/L-Glu epimerase [Solirubrobacteraceae bacterium]|jgi:L-alanine-DL-glutamate epimerase-like enolase superfamily enzyme|nr:L-Ala-D/L-Glu epimerase [Solirubrobacteraceae bacterium]